MADFSLPASSDAAEDASRLLQRLGYVVLGLGAPCSEALSSRAIFLFFPIGAALLLAAAMLSPVKGVPDRLDRAFRSPLALVGLGLAAWAVVSLLWTPYPVSAIEHLFKLVGTALVVIVALACARDHMRATDLYLFPIGVVMAMGAIITLALSEHLGLGLYGDRIDRSNVALVIMLWPAMAGLAARGRNGLARLLMILTLAFISANGAPVTTAALIVGLATLSFAISDIKRTVADLAIAAALIVLLCPIAPAIAPMLARWFFHAKLASLQGPFTLLGGAADIVLHEPFRLLTGHGLDTSIRMVDAAGAPLPIPRVALFEIWYELGVIGALFAAALVWLGFHALGATGARIAPYLVAAFACDLTLAFLSEDFSQMSWVTLLAVSALSAGAASHSTYRTKRPSAATAQPSL